MNENMDLKKQLRRAKALQVIKTALLTVLALLVLAPFIYKGTQFFAAKQSDQLNQWLWDYQTITAPNTQIDSQVISYADVFGGEVTANRSKDIDGYVVPWSKIVGKYSRFTTRVDTNELYSGEYSGSNGYYEYDRQTKQKMMSFYSPHVDNYRDGITDELAGIVATENHVIEAALSFDQPYPLSEVVKMIPDDLNLVWYWLDSEVGVATEGYSAEREYYGFQPAVGAEQDSLDWFIEAAESYDTRVSSQMLQDIIKQNKGKKAEDVLLAGVVVTGQTKNFQSLVGQKWLRSTSAGVSAEIVPYIKPVK